MLKKLKRAPAAKVEVTPARRAYLTRHIEYLRDELAKYADKPDVVNRLTLRIASAEAELGGA